MDRNKPVRRETTSDKTPRRLVAHGVRKKGLNTPPPQILTKHQLDCPFRPWRPASTAAQPRGTLSGRGLQRTLHSQPVHTQHLLITTIQSAMVIPPTVQLSGLRKETRPCPACLTRKANCVLGMHQLPRMLRLIMPTPGHHQDTHRLGSWQSQARTRTWWSVPPVHMWTLLASSRM